MTTQTLYFVHISDSHIGPTPGYSNHGHCPLPCAQRLVDIINDLPITPDFVIHSGDVVADPDPVSYTLAAETMARLNIPIYYVRGNHDAVEDIIQYLPMGAKKDVTADQGSLSYTFDLKGYRFLVLDARGPEDIDPRGQLSAGQMNIIRSQATPEGPPLIIFIHYPAHPLDSIWMDTNMLIINGDAFHQALLPAKERLRGVFSGHVHQSMQTFRDGILYVAVGSSFSQFASWPGDVDVKHEYLSPPAFNFVRLLPEQTIVNQHTFSRP